MSKTSIKQGMAQILLANVLNMIFSFVLSFLLPKYLPVFSYSQIKTYHLYIAYTAIFHFGYNDGMFLRYGGKSIEEIDYDEIELNLSTLRIFQLIMSVGCAGLAVLIRDYALLMAGLAVLPLNLTAYFKNLYQAIGEFKKYSQILNYTTCLTFLINFFLLFILKEEHFIFYLSGYVILNTLIWILLERRFHNTIGKQPVFTKFSRRDMAKDISNGFFLLLGNMSSTLLTSIDRWFVKVLLGTVSFARYSFAVTMDNFLNVAMTPLSLTLYNFFCIHDNKDDIKKVQESVTVFAAVVIAVAFPIEFLIDNILTEYLASEPIIFLLFSAQFFLIIIKCLYVNLYKARKMQNIYFTKLCIVIVAAILFNILLWLMLPQNEAFAIGTLFSAVLWFILCQFDFKEIRCWVRYYLFILVEVLAFLACGFILGSVSGIIVYGLITVIMVFVCLPQAKLTIYRMLSDRIRKFN